MQPRPSSRRFRLRRSRPCGPDLISKHELRELGFRRGPTDNLRYEFAVGRKALSRFEDTEPHLFERGRHLALIKSVGNRLIIIWHDALPEHYGDPARRCEQLQLVAEHAAFGPP